MGCGTPRRPGQGRHRPHRAGPRARHARLRARRSRRSASRSLERAVARLSGETITLDAKDSDTVQWVKAKIQHKEGVPAGRDYRMRLLLKGKRLEDERTLADYGVRDQAVLHRRLD